jgi:DNA-binding transcriptional LysR family regulator
VDLDSALLRAFVATAEENHFGRAAQRLFLTQQALSKRIKRLEEELGVKLLERTNRRVELTDAGRRLLPVARDAVDAIDAIGASVGTGERSVRVDVLFEYLAPIGWIRAAVEQDPDLRVEVSSRGNLRPTVPALRRGDFDVAFGRAMADPWPQDILRRPAVLEPIGLLVGVAHELASRRQITLAQLAQVPLFFPMAGAPEDWIGLMQALTEESGLIVDEPATTMGFEHFLDRTAQDPRAATLFGFAMAPADPTRLRLIPITDPTPVFAWSVMWRRRVPGSVIDRIVAGARSDHAVPFDDLRAPGRVWMPSVDRRWWLEWLDQNAPRHSR